MQIQTAAALDNTQINGDDSCRNNKRTRRMEAESYRRPTTQERKGKMSQ